MRISTFARPVPLPRLGRAVASGAALLLISLAVAPFAGCEERGARSQDQASLEIDGVVEQLRLTGVGTPAIEDSETLAKLRGQLGQLGARLANLPDAAPGQQAAANLLGARIASDMGRLSLDQLQSLEGRLRADRSKLSPLIDAGIQLDMLGAAAASFDPSRDKAELDRLRGQAVTALDLARQRVGELDKPLTDLVRDNEANRAVLQALERDEAALRSQARSAGPVAGFRYVEQAALKRSEADALRVRIARNDVQLSELDPEKALAALEAVQGELIIGTLDGATADLTGMTDRSQAVAEACRARVAEMRTTIGEGLGVIDGVLAGPVAERYAEAVQDFEKAAQLAQRAATSDGGREGQSAARSAVALARQSLAELHYSYALAVGNQAAFARRLAAAGGLFGDPAALGATAEALATRSNEALEQAKQAVGAALEAAGQAGSDSPQTTALKANLTALMDSISGKSLAMDTAGLPSADAAGFETPEALLAFLQKADMTNPGFVRAMPYAYRASASAPRAILAVSAMGAEDGAELMSALYAKFGPAAMNDPSLTGGIAPPDASKLELGETTENKATLKPTQPGVKPVPLVKAGGRWFIDFDGVVASMGPAGAEMKAAAQMAQGMGPMLEQMRPALKSAYADLLTKVKAGEFSSPAEVQAALQAAIAEKIGAAMMGGGGGNDAMKKAIEQAAKAAQNLSPEDLKKLMEQAGQVGAAGGGGAPSK